MASLRRGRSFPCWVVVDDGKVTSVHLEPSSAEQAAGSNGKIYEYKTHPSNPDSLFLISVEESAIWRMAGEWPSEDPKWSSAPTRVRLEHYLMDGDGMRLERQQVFQWRTGLCSRVNPSAPTDELAALANATAPPAAQWRPRLAPIRTPDSVAEQEPDRQEDPVAPTKTPLKDVDPEPHGPAQASGETPPTPSPRARLNLSKASGLLRKNAPAPIPSFAHDPAAAVLNPDLQGGLPAREEPFDEEPQEAFVPLHLQEEPSKKIKRTRPGSLKTWLAAIALLAGWTIGIFLAMQKDPSQLDALGSLLSLELAEIETIEPDRVYFRLPVEPSQQQRWARSLKMTPIDPERPFRMPTLHVLRSWEKPNTFIRPPYSPAEVEDWWSSPLHRQIISQGFFLEWEDDSLLVLDFASDQLIGWAHVHQLNAVMN